MCACVYILSVSTCNCFISAVLKFLKLTVIDFFYCNNLKIWNIRFTYFIELRRMADNLSLQTKSREDKTVFKNSLSVLLTNLYWTILLYTFCLIIKDFSLLSMMFLLTKWHSRETSGIYTFYYWLLCSCQTTHFFFSKVGLTQKNWVIWPKS